MPSSAETPPSPPSSAAGQSTKMSKKTKTVVLKLSSAFLDRFSVASTPEVEEETKPSVAASSASSPAPVLASVDDASEPRSTPPATDATAADPSKKKPSTSPKAGTKRAAGSDAGPKPRARPGPKKKLRLDDGTADTNGARASGSGTGSHKLGPKANQGAINAGLRALDRTGKPCRKWERKTFQLKSFTGATWQVPSWRAPPKLKLIDCDSKGTATPNGDNNKENNGSSAFPSEKSNGTPPFPGNTDRSPAPVTASA